MKTMANKFHPEIAILEQLLYRKRRGAKYHPQVGTIISVDGKRFHVRINNLPMQTEPFARILKGSDYRINSMGRDVAGGYIVVERVG